jgi:hypothetical protein
MPIFVFVEEHFPVSCQNSLVGVLLTKTKFLSKFIESVMIDFFVGSVFLVLVSYITRARTRWRKSTLINFFLWFLKDFSYLPNLTGWSSFNKENSFFC